MLHIYTETFRPWAKFKRQIKNLISHGLGGPKSVELSLLLGLKELGHEFIWNQKPTGKGHTACVLSGIETLKWAIKQKEAGVFSRLIAGPNIVITPFDVNNLIQNQFIDIYVVPAQWSVDWWSSLVPTLRSKLKVWPAGVNNKGSLVKKNGDILIYQKNIPKEIINVVQKRLKDLGLKYKIIFYGKFKQPEYFKLLSQSRCMIYLGQSESQGLALHEAWMADIPTLVFNPGFMKYKDYMWSEKKISAPYLNDQVGIFFVSEEDFSKKLDVFLHKLTGFTARQYSLENFTNKRCAEIFLNLINF